jgi:ferredoxin
VLSGEDTSLLIPLCATCHKTVDFDDGGKVREAHAKELTLAEMFDRESERLALFAL